MPAPPARVATRTRIAYRDIRGNGSIGLDQPRGVPRCAASARPHPNLEAGIKRVR